ncbi:hypothetical protein SC020_13830 [Legionella pneumophila serogroup 1]
MKISNFKATGLLRRYAPRNDGPKNRTVQREIIIFLFFFSLFILSYCCNNFNVRLLYMGYQCIHH